MQSYTFALRLFWCCILYKYVHCTSTYKWVIIIEGEKIPELQIGLCVKGYGGIHAMDIMNVPSKTIKALTHNVNVIVVNIKIKLIFTFQI